MKIIAKKLRDLISFLKQGKKNKIKKYKKGVTDDIYPLF